MHILHIKEFKYKHFSKKIFVCAVSVHIGGKVTLFAAETWKWQVTFIAKFAFFALINCTFPNNHECLQCLCGKDVAMLVILKVEDAIKKRIDFT